MKYRVIFRISLYKKDSPSELFRDIKLDYHIRSIWIPQTLGDQVWMGFEFKNELDKYKYIKQIETYTWNNPEPFNPSNIETWKLIDYMMTEEQISLWL